VVAVPTAFDLDMAWVRILARTSLHQVSTLGGRGREKSDGGEGMTSEKEEEGGAGKRGVGGGLGRERGGAGGKRGVGEGEGEGLGRRSEERGKVGR